MRECRRCGVEINGFALGNRIKAVGKENGRSWFSRHVKQFFSLVFHGFVKPEIEGYTELCDLCYSDFSRWLDEKKEVLNE